ncbi:hypothetical protein DV738_g1241, partial [Chaetothyriales sp. CBS 135597]
MTTVTTVTAQPTSFFHPAKRRRLASATAFVFQADGYGLATSFPSTIRLVPVNPKARLEALPAELLNLILDFSLEASLIHVSRQLWTKLPPFVPFTQTLAFQALLPLKKWERTDPILCSRASEIEHWLSCLDPDTQDAIRAKTFSASWLNEERINIVRQTLLDWTIRKTCAIYFETPPSRSQMTKIRAFVEKQRRPLMGTDLNLRLRRESKRLVYLTATPFEIEVTERKSSFYHYFEVRVVDFGNIVPDFLLQHPLTPAKHAMIAGICRLKEVRDGEIKCNLELLATLILDCINFNQLATFYELLRLAASTKVVLDLFHIERIVVLGRWRMLTPILKHSWRRKSLYRPLDVQLIRLIDEAKVNGYPNWTDTTRILAMEVAALWKIAEVEGAGGTVSRVYMQWPPRLIITMPGETCAQIWYIPKDPRYEVDWENSEFWGWIQRRMYTLS